MVSLSYDVRIVRLRLPILVVHRSRGWTAARSSGRTSTRAAAESIESAELRREASVDAALALRSGAGF